MQPVTLVGTILGLLAVFGGAMLEGLHFSAILQPTAALIVLGGTAAAVLVSFPQQDIKLAVKFLPRVFMGAGEDMRPLIAEITKFAQVARKEGILAADGMRAEVKDELLKRSLKCVVDGFDPATVGAILDAEAEQAYEEQEAAGKVWEAAGGYSPTIGIIGAVLGLIHVMQSLDDPSKIGGGIAVAFVATIYGVAAANLAFIPWGTNLKRKAHINLLRGEIVKLGVIGVQEGVNPHFLQAKLEAYAQEKNT